MVDMKLDGKDVKILKLLQKNCKAPIKDISRAIGSPITTVYAKIKKMENLGIIKDYKTILNSSKIGKNTTVFVLTSIFYDKDVKGGSFQKAVAEKIAKFPNVQEVHLISGEWDLLIKIKGENIEAVGKFVAETLRNMEGVSKTVSCVVFETFKESSDISLDDLS